MAYVGCLVNQMIHGNMETMTDYFEVPHVAPGEEAVVSVQLIAPIDPGKQTTTLTQFTALCTLQLVKVEYMTHGGSDT